MIPVFFSSSSKRDNTTILKDINPIPFEDSAYPLLLFIMTGFSSGINIQEKSSSALNDLVHVSQLRIHLVRETHFRCLHTKDIDMDTLLQVLNSSLSLRSYFEL